MLSQDPKHARRKQAALTARRLDSPGTCGRRPAHPGPAARQSAAVALHDSSTSAIGIPDATLAATSEPADAPARWQPSRTSPSCCSPCTTPTRYGRRKPPPAAGSGVGKGGGAGWGRMRRRREEARWVDAHVCRAGRLCLPYRLQQLQARTCPAGQAQQVGEAAPLLQAPSRALRKQAAAAHHNPSNRALCPRHRPHQRSQSSGRRAPWHARPACSTAAAADATRPAPAAPAAEPPPAAGRPGAAAAGPAPQQRTLAMRAAWWRVSRATGPWTTAVAVDAVPVPFAALPQDVQSLHTKAAAAYAPMESKGGDWRRPADASS